MSESVERFVISAESKSLANGGPTLYLLRIDQKKVDFWGMDISGKEAKRFDTRDDAKAMIKTLKPIDGRDYCVSPVRDFV